jgi:vacuolar-type H+-ATPase subunit E/Vma4
MKILKNLILLFLFLFFIFIFLPKENLYFQLKQQLKKYDISIIDEKIISKTFYLNIKDGSLIIKGANVAKLDDIKIYIYKALVVSKINGKATINFNLKKLSIVVKFQPTSEFKLKYKNNLNIFKKDKNKGYIYEYKLF